MAYSKEVIEHFKNPHNQGQIKDANAVGEAGSPVCGDVIKIYLDIQDDKIKDVKFETLGCAAAIAVSSTLTDVVKGMNLEEALKVTKDLLIKKLGGLPSTKIHCSMLSLEALKKAIEEYNKQEEK